MPKANANENGNIEIYVEDVRLSHPHLFVPQSYKKDKNAKPRYTAAFILDKKKDKDQIDAIEDAIDDAIAAKWGNNPPKIKSENRCLIDGDDTDKDEYQGRMVLKAAAGQDSPPAVIGRQRENLTERDGKPYGGCYVNAIVRIYAYDEYGNQVNAGLDAVQYFRKGDAFGKAPINVDEKFKDHGDDDGDARPMRSRGGRQRDEDRNEDDRGGSSRGRDRDSDRGGRSSRDEDDRGGRSRSRDREDDRSSSRGRGEEDRGRGGSRDREDEPRGRSGSRDRDDDRGSRRGSRDND